MDIRQHILNEIERRSWSRNAFAQACHDAEIYGRTGTLNYLAGERDINATAAGAMLELLGMQITRKSRGKRDGSP